MDYFEKAKEQYDFFMNNKSKLDLALTESSKDVVQVAHQQLIGIKKDLGIL